jgi:hypothetical protein
VGDAKGTGVPLPINQNADTDQRRKKRPTEMPVTPNDISRIAGHEC